MAKFRVLRLITWLPPGGIEHKIAAVLPAMNRDLFEPHVCCIRERGPLADALEEAGVPVHVVPFRNRWDLRAHNRLRDLVVHLRADLVHSHMYRSNVPATVLKLRLPHLRVVGHYHNVDTWETQRQARLDAWMARRRDMNIAVSNAVRENVIRRLSLPPALIRTLHNGVDLERFHSVSAVERHAIRTQMGWSAGTRIILMAARLVPQKNHAFVLRQLPEIFRDAPRARCIFAGAGPEQANLESLAASLGLADRVTFLGSRDDIPRLLSAADIFILPSLKEGFSNAILEAMACGLPVVASDVGGAREIIERGVNGYVIDVQKEGDSVTVNAGQFIRHMKRLLADDDFRLRLGVGALARVRAFGLDSMVSDIEGLYLDLLNRPALPAKP